MAKHVYVCTLLFLILFASVAEKQVSNAHEGEFIKAMKPNMKGKHQSLGPRKLPGIYVPQTNADEEGGCETWRCDPLNDQCYEEVACGPCVVDENDPSLFFCTDLPGSGPLVCLEEPCTEDPNHCTDIGCGECDPATGNCTLLPHGCEEQECHEVDTCVEDGCGDCDSTVCTAPPP